jgi:hypothetical protein
MLRRLLESLKRRAKEEQKPQPAYLTVSVVFYGCEEGEKVKLDAKVNLPNVGLVKGGELNIEKVSYFNEIYIYGTKELYERSQGQKDNVEVSIIIERITKKDKKIEYTEECNITHFDRDDMTITFKPVEIERGDKISVKVEIRIRV